MECPRKPVFTPAFAFSAQLSCVPSRRLYMAQLMGLARWGARSGLVLGLAAGCSDRADCGPESAVVTRVIDGDTLELVGGERVRYLLVDTPESTNGHDECFGAEASEFNRSLVEGRRVALRYAEQCRDRYARLLAYV